MSEPQTNDPTADAGRVPCRQCGRPLSAYVNKCPSCGAHTHKHSRGHDSRLAVMPKAAMIALVGITFFMVVVLGLSWLYLRWASDPTVIR